jgi:23S rRNA (adenine2030-N6)-methyltransferase
VLSYKHGFHAGNFADVHKHMVLVQLINALNQKPKPWSYLETHGGKAHYDLTDEQAEKTGEYKKGIAPVWAAAQPPTLVANYLAQVSAENTGRLLRYYPGSPAIAANMAREDDRIAIMELHANEYELINKYFKRNTQVAIHHRDGYEGVLSMLPPKPNRGVVLIDPSYEVKSEYQEVARFIKKAHQRWPIGVYAVWYPILEAGLHRAMLQSVASSGIRKVFVSEFYQKSSHSGRMFGSGMMLINPPWQLEEQLGSVMPWLERTLAESDADSSLGRWLVPE